MFIMHSLTPPSLFLKTFRSQVEGANILGHWTHEFSTESDLSCQVFYDRTDREYGPGRRVGNRPALGGRTACQTRTSSMLSRSWPEGRSLRRQPICFEERALHSIVALKMVLDPCALFPQIDGRQSYCRVVAESAAAVTYGLPGYDYSVMHELLLSISRQGCLLRFCGLSLNRGSGVTTLPEALRMAPGLDAARANSRQWAISARGFNDTFANKLLVLMYGRTIYTPLFSGVFWEETDTVLEDVDRIEVDRAVYGKLTLRF